MPRPEDKLKRARLTREATAAPGIELRADFALYSEQYEMDEL